MIKKLNIYADLASFENLRLVQLTDLHYNQPSDCKVLEQVNKISNPDYIIITGDILEQANLCDTELLEQIKKLTLICPVVIVLGNHDNMVYKNNHWTEYNGTIKQELSKIPNVHLLDNQNEEIKGINFMGATLPFSWYEEEKDYQVQSEMIASLNKSKSNCLIVHDPNIIVHMQNSGNYEEFFKEVPLILCGHTHGGLIPPIFSSNNCNTGLTLENKRISLKANQRGYIKFEDSQLFIGEALYALPKRLTFTKILKPLYPPVINVIDIKRK